MVEEEVMERKLGETASNNVATYILYSIFSTLQLTCKAKSVGSTSM